jgi:hypothetical protein
VLSKIGDVDDSVRKMALFELNRADDAFAIPLIVNLVADHRDLARAYPQIKEILYAKAMYHPDMLLPCSPGRASGRIVSCWWRWPVKSGWNCGRSAHGDPQ